jgi:hypothetical protein
MTLGNMRANPSVAPAGPVVLRQSNTCSAKHALLPIQLSLRYLNQPMRLETEHDRFP